MKKKNADKLKTTIRKGKKILCAAACAFVLLFGTIPAYADAEHSEYAKSNEMSAIKTVQSYGMTPIAGSLLKDGTWSIDVRSSSDFFKIEKCELIIDQGEMTAKLTMYSYSYKLLYMGTGEEAAAAPAEDYIEYEDIDDWYVFTIPVKALNEPIDCAAYSKKKKKWYSRKLLFDASTLDEEALNGLELPDYDLIQTAVDSYQDGDTDSTDSSASADSSDNQESTSSDSSAGTSDVQETLGGDYDVDDEKYGIPTDIDLDDGKYSINVSIAGGSGRATVSTPTLLIVKDGKAYAQLLWSSSYYDWMRVGGVTYQNESEEGANSTFTIPVSGFDTLIPVVADTTAMGDATAIQYSLTFYEESIGDEGLIPQEAAKKVVIIAVIIIVAGFFLNLIVKKRQSRT